MNSFYTAIDFIKTTLLNDPLVNTVCHGSVSDVDINKKNIFPLCHITVGDIAYGVGVIHYKFTVHVLDQRNISKLVVRDKWLRNDNELDNLNTTAAIMNKFVLTLKDQYNDQDIELVNEPSPAPIEFNFTNTLDGWATEIEISIPDTISTC